MPSLQELGFVEKDVPSPIERQLMKTRTGPAAKIVEMDKAQGKGGARGDI